MTPDEARKDEFYENITFIRHIDGDVSIKVNLKGEVRLPASMVQVFTKRTADSIAVALKERIILDLDDLTDVAKVAIADGMGVK